jgi:hypothetical protein
LARRETGAITAAVGIDGSTFDVVVTEVIVWTVSEVQDAP